jgi:membrane carboxypeptidase/penicillin-binding protein PbpC
MSIPGYLALLKAYEDQRFDRHGGVDGLIGGLRAAWQICAMAASSRADRR